MRSDFIELAKPDPGPTGTGDVHRIADYEKCVIQFEIPAGNVDVEISVDGVNFEDAPSMTASAADAIVALPDFPIQFIRLVVNTDIVAGIVTFGGRNSRTD